MGKTRIFGGKIALYGSKSWESLSLIDPDAEAFLLAAEITDDTEISAINQLVIDLKNNNLWTKMRAVYPFVGGTSTTHKFNLMDPRDLDVAYRLTFNGGIIHSSTGVLPNGNSFADTYLDPSVTNYISLSYYSRTPGAHVSGGNVIGSFAGGGFGNISTRMLIRYIGSPNTTVFGANYPDAVTPNARTFTDTDGSGFYIGTRTSTDSTLFIRGLLAASNTDGNAGLNLPPFSRYLFAYNNTGQGPLLFTDKECAFSHIGDGLTNSECIVLTTIVDNFQITLGRNV